MELKLFQVDAFASRVFQGNPAAVVPLEEWLPDETLQAIALENNLSETAFVIPGEVSRLRWFTPAMEVDLCGHATLATAHVLVRHLGCSDDVLRFETLSGELRVRVADERLVLDFPSRPGEPVEVDVDLERALGGRTMTDMRMARDALCVYETEADVRALKPDMAYLVANELFVIATAPGDACDFVSRFFAPLAGVPEDPVTGSAHCTSIPYWSKRLGRAEMAACQVSARGGELFCRDNGERVDIGGRAVTYLVGTIQV